MKFPNNPLTPSQLDARWCSRMTTHCTIDLWTAALGTFLLTREFPCIREYFQEISLSVLTT
jgi:hypothetical protein